MGFLALACGFAVNNNISKRAEHLAQDWRWVALARRLPIDLDITEPTEHPASWHWGVSGRSHCGGCLQVADARAQHESYENLGHPAYLFDFLTYFCRCKRSEQSPC